MATITLKKLQSRFKSKMRKLRSIARTGGSDVVVTSYIRTDWGNEEVGGAPQSRHLIGLAADVQFVGAPFVGLEYFAPYLGLRVISYTNHQHLDLAMNAEESVWVQNYFSLRGVLLQSTPPSPVLTEVEPATGRPTVYPPVPQGRGPNYSAGVQFLGPPRGGVDPGSQNPVPFGSGNYEFRPQAGWLWWQDPRFKSWQRASPWV